MAPQRGRSKGDDGSDALLQLDIERGRNDQKLKSRFEDIFRKYEHDFTGIGDEFDIHTDEIVVNNGHLEHMRSEVDSGSTASSHFVKTFRDKLAHEDESGSSDEGEETDDDDETQMLADDSDEGLEDVGIVQPMRRAPAASRPTEPGIGGQRLVSLGPDRRPPRLPQLMRLLAGEGTPQRPVEIPDDYDSEHESVTSEATTYTTATDAVVDDGRYQRQSSYAESRASRARSQRPQADDDTVHALGMSIANQLAKLIGATSKKKKKKPTAMHRAADPIWSYPEIDRSSKTKRKRTKSPVPQPQLPSLGAISPDNRSLWSVSESTRSGKRRRSERASSTASTVVRRFGKASDSAESKRCWNCSLTRSSSWQKGPHGQDLCQSCGQYYEHHGRMKGFDSATPPPTDEHQSAEQEDLESVSVASEVPAMLELQRPSRGISLNTADHGVQWKALENKPQIAAPPPQIAAPPPQIAAPPPQIAAPPPQVAAPPPQIAAPPPQIAVTPPQIAAPPRENTPQIAATPTKDEPRATPNVPYTANTSRLMVSSDPKRRAWTVEEDALIIRLKEYDRLTWDAIAEYFPGRAATAVQKNYSYKLKGVDCPARVMFNDQLHADEIARNVTGTQTNGTGTPDWQWSAQQDEMLLELREGDELDWNEISEMLPGHSPAAVERRYEILAGPRPSKRQPAASHQTQNPETAWPTWQRYTPEEDALIIQLREVDCLSWQQIAQRFENRSVYSIQSRYSGTLNLMKREGTPTVPANTVASLPAGGRNTMTQQSPPTIVSAQSSGEPQPRRSRHSLPTATATSRRSGNALLRQALGNSHRRRSYHDSFMPMHATAPEPFALDPRLREQGSASHVAAGAGNPEDSMTLGDVDSSGASLQLQVDMQRAQALETQVSMHPTMSGSTLDTARSRGSIAPRQSTWPPPVTPSQRASVQPVPAANGALDHASNRDPASTFLQASGIVQPVYIHDAEDDVTDETYVPPAEGSNSAARQGLAREGFPRTRSRQHLERNKLATPTMLADTIDDSLADLDIPPQDSTITVASDTERLAHPPRISFAQMVAMAFSSAATTSMSIKEICSWIETNYGYYSTAPRGWKNFVRDELRMNEKYEVSVFRQRNSVWRIKTQHSDELSTGNDVTVEGAHQPDMDDTPTIPDSDEIVVSTPALQSARSSGRRVTFSPVVTVTTPVVKVITPVPKMRLNSRRTSSMQWSAAKPARKKSTEAPEVPDSASPSASPIEMTSSAPQAAANADAADVYPIAEDESAADNARMTSRKASTRSGKSQKQKSSVGTASAEEPVSADSSRSLSTKVDHTPASVFKTPRQPGWPRISRLKPHSDPARRHSTPIINHKFMTPDAGMRKRVVETPVRELRDPEEDELAG